MISQVMDLELIRDLGDEGGDLFHEAVHAALTARLQQRGDGQSSDAAVRVSDQVLQVQVTGGHCRWVLHCHLVDTERGTVITKTEQDAVCVCVRMRETYVKSQSSVHTLRLKRCSNPAAL